ncbi:class I SAM-dependent methyltransferase [Hyphomicrobium sp. CS1GBMeth3]|uniref:class I SAM-dependent methyltransferase n=1 Tax=Hyphomicrobium sp. CS1GBMeth3 TaxID=1892845 RepID=UPI0009319E15|nr:class I SAM-dependent methyltransferase [Hyphomicrobium sp. CS1GBMeth3]
MLKQIATASLGEERARQLKHHLHARLQTARKPLHVVNRYFAAPLHRAVVNPINRARHEGRTDRKLEIGPGSDVLDGFETLDVITGSNVTYVGQALSLPFRDDTFQVVYASHIIEHVPWYQVPMALKEWVRVLQPGGQLKVWTPDGLKIAKAFVEAEESGETDFHKDGWWRFNEGHDPCVWASGRCFSYGDGTGRNDHPNWHRALFSPRYLKQLFRGAGLVEIREMDRSEVLGHDHGWINLGVCGTKPKLEG